MRLAAAAAAVVLAAGCQGPRIAHGWSVQGDVTPEWAAGALALAACVEQATHPAPGWGGVIVVHPGPFECRPDPWAPYPILCAGWNPGGERVEVAWTDNPGTGALAHELGHAALCRPSGGWDCTETSANAVSTAARECVARRAAARRADAVPARGGVQQEP